MTWTTRSLSLCNSDFKSNQYTSSGNIFDQHLWFKCQNCPITPHSLSVLFSFSCCNALWELRVIIVTIHYVGGTYFIVIFRSSSTYCIVRLTSGQICQIITQFSLLYTLCSKITSKILHLLTYTHTLILPVTIFSM